MKKRIIALILASVMVLAMLAGCGKDKKKGSGDDGILVVGVPQSSTISSYTENDFTKWIEEQLDIELEFVYYNGGDEGIRQFTLDCAAEKFEDMPDVIWGFQSMSNYALNDLGEDGYVLDLKPYLDEEHFPNFFEALKDVPEADKKTALEKGTNPDDGGYYGMPLIALEHVDNLGNMPFINVKWLKDLGLKKPTNVDELYTVLKAFKERDPNGNGKADELPMVGAAANGGGLSQYLMNAFIYWDASNAYNVMNGRIYSPMITDQFRQGLIYINKLYSEGLIAEMSFSGSTHTDFVNINTPADQVAKAGIWFGHPSIYTDANTTILDQYEALPYLADETGLGGYTVFNANAIKWCSWICAHTERVNTAMKFLDLMYTDEAMTRMRMGAKDIYWHYGEEGLNIKGKPTSIYVDDDSAFFGGDSTWGINGNCIMNDANYTGVEGDSIPGTRTAEIERIMKQLWNELCVAGKRPAETAEHLIYTSEDFDRKNELNGKFYSYYGEALTLFCTGKRNPNSDKEWNDFKAQMDKLGRTEIEGIVQRAYDRQKAAN